MFKLRDRSKHGARSLSRRRPPPPSISPPAGSTSFFRFLFFAAAVFLQGGKVRVIAVTSPKTSAGAAGCFRRWGEAGLCRASARHFGSGSLRRRARRSALSPSSNAAFVEAVRDPQVATADGRSGRPRRTPTTPGAIRGVHRFRKTERMGQLSARGRSKGGMSLTRASQTQYSTLGSALTRAPARTRRTRQARRCASPCSKVGVPGEDRGDVAKRPRSGRASLAGGNGGAARLLGRLVVRRVSHDEETCPSAW